eukprot:gnl/MRDRNA2_/MRDRNA2_27548_c0_seq1.p1 gnl/MRDRNA2_/MRDRNA2_27548_c0~~gnl/MRDRNA2_/MRDRNA2_27548_c0_seq1.p1  ORF type:complete len:290 (+),score=53.62 gnl/MRDRNA2_/MRDRNA2_27548_c0_seq1:86-955(+)
MSTFSAYSYFNTDTSVESQKNDHEQHKAAYQADNALEQAVVLLREQCDDESSPQVLCILEDQSRLLRFIHACNGDAESAVSLIFRYANCYDDGLAPSPREEAMVMLHDELVTVMPWRDLQKRPVFVMQDVTVLKDLFQEYGSYNAFWKLYGAYSLLLDVLLNDEETQQNGVTVIQDLSSLDYEIIVAMMDPRLVVAQSRVIWQMTRCYPIKWGHIVLVDAPSVFDMLWVLLKGFFPESFVSKMHFLYRPNAQAELVTLLGFDPLDSSAPTMGLTQILDGTVPMARSEIT